jgi:hypothetical protein
MKQINNRCVYEFADLEVARAFSNRCNKPMQIVFGDAPYYWVTSLADAEWLVKKGYELLETAT